MEPNFQRDQFVKRPKGTPCPALVWFIISRANEWLEAPVQPLRTIARSPTPFKLKSPDLKKALEHFGLEWLTPSQISRIRECLAPSYKVIHDRYDRRLRFYRAWEYEQAPRCRKFFWAWRADQKTCDDHLEYAGMFRVQKHRKGKQKKRDNLRQLKEARLQLRRKRRAYKRLQRLTRVTPAPPLTQSQLQAQNDRANLQLLKLIRLDYELEAKDSDRLEAMIKDGYVIPDPDEPGTYKITGPGLQRLRDLRTQVGRGPALT